MDLTIGNTVRYTGSQASLAAARGTVIGTDPARGRVLVDFPGAEPREVWVEPGEVAVLNGSSAPAEAAEDCIGVHTHRDMGATLIAAARHNEVQESVPEIERGLTDRPGEIEGGTLVWYQDGYWAVASGSEKANTYREDVWTARPDDDPNAFPRWLLPKMRGDWPQPWRFAGNQQWWRHAEEATGLRTTARERASSGAAEEVVPVVHEAAERAPITTAEQARAISQHIDWQLSERDRVWRGRGRLTGSEYEIRARRLR